MNVALVIGIAVALLIPREALAQTPADAVSPDTRTIPTVIVSDPKSRAAPDPLPQLVRDPTQRDLNRFYPSIARRTKVEAFVWLHCVAQDDQTLNCDQAQTNVLDVHTSQPLKTTPEIIAAFVAAGATAQRKLRVLPTLRNGKPSAGHVLLILLAFRGNG